MMNVPAPPGPTSTGGASGSVPPSPASPSVGTPAPVGDQPALFGSDPLALLGWLAALVLGAVLARVWWRSRTRPPAAVPAAAPAVHAALTVRTPGYTPSLLGERRSPAARYPWLLPVDPAHPGLTADEACLGDLEVRAASIVGPGHRCEDPAGPRQDVYRLGRDRAGEHLIVAVADGVSTSARSDLGATVAASAAVVEVRRRLDSGCTVAQLQAAAVFDAVARQMLGAARDRGVPAQAVACALLVAVVPARPQARGGRGVWFGHLADVSAWSSAGSAGWRRLTGEEKTGLDRNTVDAVLPLHPQRAVDVRRDVAGAATLAILSDGVSDAFAEVEGARFWFAQRWAEPPPLASFVLDVNFEARGQLDDRTAVVVWCGGAR
jgi:hypothetical protein